jgi:hypothetical protein
MPLYKVLFKDNVAVSAKEIGNDTYNTDKSTVEFGMEHGKKVILWFILEADSDTDAMEVASTVVRQIFIMPASILKLTISGKDYWYSKTNQTLYYDSTLLRYCPLSIFTASESESLSEQIKPGGKSTHIARNKLTKHR